MTEDTQGRGAGGRLAIIFSWAEVLFEAADKDMNNSSVYLLDAVSKALMRYDNREIAQIF